VKSELAIKQQQLQQQVDHELPECKVRKTTTTTTTTTSGPRTVRMEGD
jgi:hypothetical protein